MSDRRHMRNMFLQNRCTGSRRINPKFHSKMLQVPVCIRCFPLLRGRRIFGYPFHLLHVGPIRFIKQAKGCDVFKCSLSCTCFDFDFDGGQQVDFAGLQIRRIPRRLWLCDALRFQWRDTCEGGRVLYDEYKMPKRPDPIPLPLPLLRDALQARCCSCCCCCCARGRRWCRCCCCCYCCCYCCCCCCARGRRWCRCCYCCCC